MNKKNKKTGKRQAKNYIFAASKTQAV